MSAYYVYLLSSLPFLLFQGKPPLSWTRFLELCEGLISEKETHLVRAAAEDPGPVGECAQPTIVAWRSFEVALRNELVKVRAASLHKDVNKYIKPLEGYFDTDLAHLAQSAHRSPSILEGEMILDQARWKVLDDLSTGHYFDLDALIVYALKLKILIRWEKIRSADSRRLLDETLAPA